MKLLRAVSTSAVIALAGVGSLLQANAVIAEVVCDASGQVTPSGTKVGGCTWTAPWGKNVGVRLTIGMDQNNKLRWVASPVGNPQKIQTGLIASPNNWDFEGSDQNDVMMEVPWGAGTPTFAHGNYQLKGGFFLDGVISFHSGKGNDIVIGGDHTYDIVNGDGSAQELALSGTAT